MKIPKATNPAALAGDGGTDMVGGRVAPGIGVRRLQRNKNADRVSVNDFGAVGDGVTDDAAAIQAAIEWSYANGGKKVYAPAGVYGVGATIYLRDGVEFYGDGTNENVGKGTVFKSLGEFGGNVFGVTGRGPYNGRYFWAGQVHGFTVLGNVAAAAQWGLSFRDAVGNKICPQDISSFHHLFFRYLKSGGMEFPDAAIPLNIHRVKAHWCGGPAIYINGNGSPNVLITMGSVSGDGNNGGLIVFENFSKECAATIYDVKAERFDSPDFPGGDQQSSTIVFKNCAGFRVQIVGGSSISAVPDGATFRKPGDFIAVLAGASPAITWSNVAVRVRPGDTGPDPAIITNVATGQAVPYSTSSGSFMPAGSERADTGDGAQYRVLGFSRYTNKSVEDSGQQVAGLTPAYTTYETDAAANEKTWGWFASGGNYSLRAVDDAGVGIIVGQAHRVGGAPSRWEWSVTTQWGDGCNLQFGTATGTKIGISTSNKLAFWGVVPIGQPAASAQAAVVGAAGATYTATEQGLINAALTLLNRMRADLVAVGLIKGGA